MTCLISQLVGVLAVWIIPFTNILLVSVFTLRLVMFKGNSLRSRMVLVGKWMRNVKHLGLMGSVLDVFLVMI